MGKKHRGAATRALAQLEDAGVAYRVYTYTHSARAKSFGGEAAAQIGGDPARMFKTLLVECEGGEFVVACVPVTAHLSLKLVAKAAGHKNAQMADPAVAQRRTGYVVGGISPLGQTTTHRTFIDASARGFDEILVSGGKRGMSVGVAPDDLAKLTGAEFVDIEAID
ncbi:MAG: Cys-tRNA(Pro) deacylase [Actinomycetaceae bacterium]|mgnify:CR=1 FL=1|nr:Cys-tRNA(Pro) deacylase [Actinomycetaceae bacterium]MDU0970590.1 Cys-tRNA(Pro) deacylase [Actinomycetaceae bacterium]